MESKILLIIQREFLSRVKKRSFVIMTLLGPILLAIIMILPAWLALKQADIQFVEVVDETGVFSPMLENANNVTFIDKQRSFSEAREKFREEHSTALLYIPYNALNQEKTTQLFYENQPGLGTLRHIENQLAEVSNEFKLITTYKLSERDIKALKVEYKIVLKKISENGIVEDDNAVLSTALGFGAGLLIYTFILLYGIQVMRGVLEEKTNRIVEVIISSVKPFQLMMGKIIGIALVSLTQFALWIILTLVVVNLGTHYFKKVIETQNEQMKSMEEFLPEAKEQVTIGAGEVFAETQKSLEQINFPVIIACFLFFFIAGYLLYATFFAAVGSAVDSEADTQQFMMPVTLPLIFSFLVVQLILENPDGDLAFWMSMFPLTSPIIMMIRIPFGIPYWEIILSMFILSLSFIFFTWISGKIYRIGILMYGKKPSYKEIFKWLFYKE